jgi:hypothetical protein
MYVFVFVLTSIVARVWQGAWLRKAGPFEVSDEVRTITQERDRLAARARETDSDIQRLKESLANSDGVIRTLSEGLPSKQSPAMGRGLLRRGRGRVR